MLFSANRLAFEIEERREISTHFLSEWCSHKAIHFTRRDMMSADIGPTAAALDISQQPEMVPKPSSPLLSTYRLVSSSSDHSIPASIPTPSSLMSRGRVDVAALGPRAQATEMTSHSHQPTTVTKIETCGLSEHRLDSSPEPLQPQPIVPVSRD
ncbi:hypothetical protein BGY98DRAFT_1100202 [Russula aff. rugulosa BPL654]|nr:hypothetical protein BGY98DRAFT_1100202 [Russula aff. rugulosa BPL654]